MHNNEKWPNTFFKSCGVNTGRFLKYACPFFNIIHERVNRFSINFTFVLMVSNISSISLQNIRNHKINQFLANVSFFYPLKTPGNLWFWWYKMGILARNGLRVILIKNELTHSFPMHPFFAPWKHQKTVRFSDFFRA